MTTATSTISATARALLDGAQQKFAAAEARTEAGGLGWWPPDGKHENLVLSLVIEDAEAELPNSGGRKIPCARVYPTYQLTEAGKVSAGVAPDEPGEWRGDSISVYSDADFAALPENWQTAVGISYDRLKGHLKTLLRLSDAELSAMPLGALAVQAQEKLAAAPAVCVVQCQTRVQKKNIAPGATPKQYKSDYICELSSG